MLSAEMGMAVCRSGYGCMNVGVNARDNLETLILYNMITTSRARRNGAITAADL